jgi:hypothetical protein
MLRRELTRQNLRKSKARNQFTTRDGFDSVDWDSVSRSSKTYPQQFRLWMTKHVAGCNYSGQLQVHLGRHETNLCPLCKTEIETSQHHVLCIHPDRQQIYEEDLQSLLLWMQTKTSDPYFAAAFYKFLLQRGAVSLSTICDDEDSAIDGNCSSTDSESDSDVSSATDHAIAPTLRDLAQQLDSIGFDNVMFGRLPLLLSPYQHAHFRMIGSQWHGGRQRHGGAWVKQLCCKLLEISHNQ